MHKPLIFTLLFSCSIVVNKCYKYLSSYDDLWDDYGDYDDNDYIDYDDDYNDDADYGYGWVADYANDNDYDEFNDYDDDFNDYYYDDDANNYNYNNYENELDDFYFDDDDYYDEYGNDYDYDYDYGDDYYDDNDYGGDYYADYYNDDSSSYYDDYDDDYDGDYDDDYYGDDYYGSYYGDDDYTDYDYDYDDIYAGADQDVAFDYDDFALQDVSLKSLDDYTLYFNEHSFDWQTVSDWASFTAHNAYDAASNSYFEQIEACTIGFEQIGNRQVCIESKHGPGFRIKFQAATPLQLKTADAPASGAHYLDAIQLDWDNSQDWSSITAAQDVQQAYDYSHDSRYLAQLIEMMRYPRGRHGLMHSLRNRRKRMQLARARNRNRRRKQSLKERVRRLHKKAAHAAHKLSRRIREKRKQLRHKARHNERARSWMRRHKRAAKKRLRRKSNLLRQRVRERKRKRRIRKRNRKQLRGKEARWQKLMSRLEKLLKKRTKRCSKLHSSSKTNCEYYRHNCMKEGGIHSVASRPKRLGRSKHRLRRSKRHTKRRARRAAHREERRSKKMVNHETRLLKRHFIRQGRRAKRSFGRWKRQYKRLQRKAAKHRRYLKRRARRKKRRMRLRFHIANHRRRQHLRKIKRRSRFRRKIRHEDKSLKHENKKLEKKIKKVKKPGEENDLKAGFENNELEEKLMKSELKGDKLKVKEKKEKEEVKEEKGKEKEEEEKEKDEELKEKEEEEKEKEAEENEGKAEKEKEKEEKPKKKEKDKEKGKGKGRGFPPFPFWPPPPPPPAYFPFGPGFPSPELGMRGGFPVAQQQKKPETENENENEKPPKPAKSAKCTSVHPHFELCSKYYPGENHLSLHLKFGSHKKAKSESEPEPESEPESRPLPIYPDAYASMYDMYLVNDDYYYDNDEDDVDVDDDDDLEYSKALKQMIELERAEELEYNQAIQSYQMGPMQQISARFLDYNLYDDDDDDDDYDDYADDEYNDFDDYYYDQLDNDGNDYSDAQIGDEWYNDQTIIQMNEFGDSLGFANWRAEQLDWHSFEDITDQPAVSAKNIHYDDYGDFDEFGKYSQFFTELNFDWSDDQDWDAVEHAYSGKPGESSPYADGIKCTGIVPQMFGRVCLSIADHESKASVYFAAAALEEMQDILDISDELQQQGDEKGELSQFSTAQLSELQEFLASEYDSYNLDFNDDSHWDEIYVDSSNSNNRASTEEPPLGPSRLAEFMHANGGTAIPLAPQQGLNEKTDNKEPFSLPKLLQLFSSFSGAGHDDDHDDDNDNGVIGPPFSNMHEHFVAAAPPPPRVRKCKKVGVVFIVCIFVDMQNMQFNLHVRVANGKQKHNSANHLVHMIIHSPMRQSLPEFSESFLNPNFNFNHDNQQHTHINAFSAQNNFQNYMDLNAGDVDELYSLVSSIDERQFNADDEWDTIEIVDMRDGVNSGLFGNLKEQETSFMSKVVKKCSRAFGMDWCYCKTDAVILPFACFSTDSGQISSAIALQDESNYLFYDEYGDDDDLDYDDYSDYGDGYRYDDELDDEYDDEYDDDDEYNDGEYDDEYYYT